MKRDVRYYPDRDKILKVTEDGLRINVYPDLGGKVTVQQPGRPHSKYKKGLK